MIGKKITGPQRPCKQSGFNFILKNIFILFEKNDREKEKEKERER